MVRTFLLVCIVIATILWTPWWIQLGAWGIALILSPYPLFLIIPAIVADVLYAPAAGGILGYIRVTLVAAVVLLLYVGIVRHTRVSHTV